MESSDHLRIVSDRARINQSLISELEGALSRAKDGDIEGFCLVTLSDSVERSGYFEDRLRMMGALSMSLLATSNLVESS